MAEEPTVDIQVNQETINIPLSESPKRIQLEEEDVHGNGRRKIGNLITLKGEGKVSSRYLRASTGSCHDFCKYGHRHGFNEETKIPVSTITKRRMAEIGEDKKKAAINEEQKRKSLPNLTHNRRYSEIASTICRPTTVKKKSDISLPKAKPAPPLPPINKSLWNQIKQHNHTKVVGIPEIKSTAKEITDEEVPEKTLYIIEPNPNGNNQTNVETKLSGCEVDVHPIHHQSLSPSSKSNILKSKRTGKKPASLPLPLTKSTKSIKTDIPKAGTIRPQNSKDGRTSSGNKSGSLYNNTRAFRTLKQKDGGVSSAKKSDPSRKLNLNRGKTGDLPSETTSQFRSIKNPDSARKLNFRRGKIIDLPSENTPPRRLNFKLSRQSSSGKKPIPQKSFTQQNISGGKARARIVETVKENSSRLNFRRGKVIDIKPINTTPKRLKFRPSRFGVESQTGKTNGPKRISGNGNCNHLGKVILRHREVENKRKSQSSVNNVIEETANKLVQTRKSKVKALVGAFETIISLKR